jgi:hypothetical protein
MNWSFRKGTTITRRILTYWWGQGLNISYWIAYLVKVYNIPSSLVVNNNRTKVHLLLIVSERTWEIKGKKYVKILGMDYKRKVTMVVSIIVSVLLLPLQIVFVGNIFCSFPPPSEEKKCNIVDGHDFTFLQITGLH